MAGPGKRGQVLKRQSQGVQEQSTPESSRGSGGVLTRTPSNEPIFHTPNSSPLQGPVNQITPEQQLHTSESRTSRENETSLSAGASQECTPGYSSTRKRGATRNIALARKRLADSTLTIEVNQGDQRIVGQDSQYFITESSCIVRKMGRLNVPKWSKLDEDLRKDMYKSSKDAFQVNDVSHTEAAIYQQMNRSYRSWRYRLHQIFLKYETKEEAIKHVPENVSESDWIWLCDYFDSEDFKKLSERNKKNRTDQQTPTTVGTKSLARVLEEKKRIEGVELSEIELYERSRYSMKKGCFVNQKAQETLDKMKELQATTSLTPREICMNEVGYIPGHQSRGFSKSQAAAAIAQFRAEVEESKRRAAEAEERAKAIAEQFNAQTEQFNAQKEEIQRLKEQQEESSRLYLQLAEKLKELGK